MNNFLIYRSSAGSGKTFTLVKEYLKLVLANPECYRNILAVTFTNKSAEEMKTRIVSSLAELSKGGAGKLHDLLKSEGVKTDIKQNAELVLKNILHNYSYFAVSTIDSFFHRVIRAFAKELKLQLGYNIELDQAEVLEKITDKLLDEAGLNEELTRFIEEYIFYSIDDEKGWNVDRKIRSLAQEIFKERYWIRKGDSETLADSREKLKTFIGKLFAIKNEFEGFMRDTSEKALVITEEHSLTMDDFPYKTGGYINYLLNKIRFGDYDPKARARESAGDIKKMCNKTSKPAVKAAAEAGLYTLLKDAVDYYDSRYIKYNTAAQLIKTVYVLGIFKDLLEKLKVYRDDNRLLLISDINTILLKVITGDSSPFVYEKIGNYYRYFLIDEFQDTSTFQWKNFLPLLENSLSENNGSLIVGDVKQSIYRWRNGNMKLLLEDVKNDLAGFSPMIKEENLASNFRSRKEIIDFNNLFFKRAAEITAEGAPEAYRHLISRSYSESAQSSGTGNSGGSVCIDFFKTDEDTGRTARELSAMDIVSKIKSLLSEGFKQSDIMILVRGLADASEAAHFLIDAGLKVVSSESLLLTNSPKVRLITNVFIYLNDSSNVIARTEILYNYMVYIKGKDADLNAIFTDHLKTSGSLFSSKMPESFIEQDSGEIKSRLYGMGLYELAEELIRIFKLGGNADAYLLRFLDVIKEYADEKTGGLNGFIEWWQEKSASASIIVPSEAEAVKVMTIHKAKGLQSPVVFMPYVNWDMDIKGTRDLIWVSSDEPPFNESSAFLVKASKELEQSYFAEDYNEEAALTNLDNLNLLYVAFTRAEERLYINIPSKGKKSNHTGKLVYETITSAPEFSTLYDNTNARLIYGKPVKGKSKAGGNIPEVLTIDEIVSNDIYNKLLMKKEYVGFVPELKNDLEQSKNRGIILHRALSILKAANEIDINAAAEKLVALGILKAEQKSSLVAELKKIIRSPEIKEWFSEKAETFNERDIIQPGGEIYRPDKVVIKQNSASIIDFKTGGEVTEHNVQVKNYVSLLQSMGYKDVKGYLFYVNELKAVEVN
ncbi:MAG: UvrD-helicase domain-containing protein [Ignavibacteria bacterium]|nr:UvrD-helicase domain-containing protein [Ignavibacteria bacterium]